MTAGGPDGVSRRSVLAAVGSAVVVGTAGCLAGDGSNDDGSGGEGSTDEATPGTSDLLPGPSLGPEDADVTVEVYKDFACPHCATYAEDVEPEIAGEYVDSGVVRLVHHDFPIPVDDPESWRAANAARAVQAEADDEAFFAFADRLFAHQSDLGLDTYAALAVEISGDAARSAAEDRRYQDTVDHDRSSGVDRGVRGTPTVFVDDEELDGYSWDTVQSAIEDARPDSDYCRSVPDRPHASCGRTGKSRQ